MSFKPGDKTRFVSDVDILKENSLPPVCAGMEVEIMAILNIAGNYIVDVIDPKFPTAYKRTGWAARDKDLEPIPKPEAIEYSFHEIWD